MGPHNTGMVNATTDFSNVSITAGKRGFSDATNITLHYESQVQNLMAELESSKKLNEELTEENDVLANEIQDIIKENEELVSSLQDTVQENDHLKTLVESLAEQRDQFDEKMELQREMLQKTLTQERKNANESNNQMLKLNESLEGCILQTKKEKFDIEQRLGSLLKQNQKPDTQELIDNLRFKRCQSHAQVSSLMCTKDNDAFNRMSSTGKIDLGCSSTEDNGVLNRRSSTGKIDLGWSSTKENDVLHRRRSTGKIQLGCSVSSSNSGFDLSSSLYNKGTNKQHSRQVDISTAHTDAESGETTDAKTSNYISFEPGNSPISRNIKSELRFFPVNNHGVGSTGEMLVNFPNEKSNGSNGKMQNNVSSREKYRSRTTRCVSWQGLSKLGKRGFSRNKLRSKEETFDIKNKKNAEWNMPGSTLYDRDYQGLEF